MYSYINIFVTLLLVSSLLTFIAAVIAWRRSVPGLTSLTLLLIAMGLWAALYAFQWLPLPSAVQNVLPKLTYIGVVAVPGLFLVFALAFAHYDRFLRKRLFLGLLLEPAITLFLVWTNKFHHLVFSSLIFRVSDGFIQPEFIHGSWYYLNLIYSYLAVAAGIAALVSGYLRCHPSAKKLPFFVTQAMQ